MSEYKTKAKFQIDEMVAIKTEEWTTSWYNWVSSKLTDKTLKKDSNNQLQGILGEFYNKASQKVVGVRRKIDYEEPRDRYKRKIFDSFEYLLEKKILNDSQDIWMDEVLICPISEKLQELMVFSEHLNNGIKKFIEELNGPIEEKVVDIEEDDGVQLEL